MTDEFNYYGREEFSSSFFSAIVREDITKHILLNGKWGSGKTMLINQMHEEIKRNHDKYTNPDTEINDQDEEGDHYQTLSIYFNAWKLDYLDDPITAFFKLLVDEGLITEHALRANLNGDDEVEKNQILKFGKKNIGVLIKQLIKHYSGIDLEGYDFDIDDHHISRFIDDFEYKEKMNKIIHNLIRDSRNEHANRLVIFIDELDRAKPEFLVKVLELFHHIDLGDIPTTFIYSADKEAIVEMLSGYYGFTTRGSEYLEKMMDVELSLPSLTIESAKDYINTKTFSTLQLSNAVTKDCLAGIVIDKSMSFRNINTISAKISDDFVRQVEMKCELGCYEYPGQLKRSMYYNQLVFKGDNRHASIFEFFPWQVRNMIIFLNILKLIDGDYYLGYSRLWRESSAKRKQIVDNISSIIIASGRIDTFQPHYIIRERFDADNIESVRIFSDNSELTKQRASELDSYLEFHEMVLFSVLDFILEWERDSFRDVV